MTSETQSEPTEAQVKAAFLFNFVRFVDWPATAFSSKDSPFVIGIVGVSAVEIALRAMAAEKTINGRPVNVRGGEDLARIGPVHLLFFPSSEKKRATLMVESLKSLPVLIVGEVADFAHSGGMANFFLDNDRVRFEMNPDTAERAGLKIRSQLLVLARIVRNP